VASDYGARVSIADLCLGCGRRLPGSRQPNLLRTITGSPNHLVHMDYQLSWKVSLRGRVASVNGKAAGFQDGLDSAETVRRL
jgi:hypothetical protein